MSLVYSLSEYMGDNHIFGCATHVSSAVNKPRMKEIMFEHISHYVYPQTDIRKLEI